MREEPKPTAEERRARPEAGVSAEEALGRARAHARLAARESLTALRWLIEAGSLATTGAPSEKQRWIGALARFLDSAATGFESEDADVGSRLLESVAEALDREIERWEERSRTDPDARPVLRAFLGLREILWEFGLRPAASKPPNDRAAGERRQHPRRSGGLRGSGSPSIERVPVEG